MKEPMNHEIDKYWEKCARTFNFIPVAVLAMLSVTVLISWTGVSGAPEVMESKRVWVVDGVVMPCRPVGEAIAHAMQFLKKADGGYVPGRIDGELAGYFTRAHVNEDGPLDRSGLSARQHAYSYSRSAIPIHR
jgi:hypothetical protein